jgi:hypothetical protein
MGIIGSRCLWRNAQAGFEMKLKLTRQHTNETNFTEGTLSIDGVFFCDTMEDKERPVKIAGKTAIPLGIYKVIINQSVRFKKMMPLLIDVPNFAGVRIHAGNTAEDTEGCILVGMSLRYGFIGKSRDTFNALMVILNEAKAKQDPIILEIV